MNVLIWIQRTKGTVASVERLVWTAKMHGMILMEYIWFYQDCNLFKTLIQQNRFVTRVLKLVNVFDFWLGGKNLQSSEIISIWFTTIELPWKLLLLLVMYIAASPLSFLCWCFPKLFIMICEGQRVHIFNSHLRRSLRKVIRESTRRAAKDLIVVSEKTKLTWLTG